MSQKAQTYFIQTFGCQQNAADSERIAQQLANRGMRQAKNIQRADYIVINTCMVRESAENRVYGLVNNLGKLKSQTSKRITITKNKKQRKPKIVVTGCMVGMAMRDKTGKFLQKLKKRMPAVDEFLPIEEVGFDHAPLRTDSTHAWVPISNGCNNFCTFCVVPFTRGREISRPFDAIISEVHELVAKGYTSITLLGMNVNSYGADLLLGEENVHVMRDLDLKYFAKSSQTSQQKQLSHLTKKIQTNKKQKNNYKPVYVKHLNRLRIPTLFPQLLETIAHIPQLQKIDFLTSNPWDFSDELITVIANNKTVSRHIHLPVQAGDDAVLKKMNRWYTAEQYLSLIAKLRNRIPDITISTDIIVGFCGETKEQFQNTVLLCKKAQFSKAYVAMYSDRPMTAAHKVLVNDVLHSEKKRRWKVLDTLINQKNLAKGTYPVEVHRKYATISKK